MINKKFIIIALLVGLFSTNIVNADSSNSLLKMDVKRASVADSVDVTFYTTDGSYNSVVTRKSDNRYVVLLPNTASASSIVPSLGGVKDLISDINVKNVDDGIGGYTKVTFTTTKPGKIQTYTKKTAPLTKAQEEYKNLIAKQDSIPAASVKPASSNTTKPAASTNTSASTVKPAVSTTKSSEDKKISPAANAKNNTQTTKTAVPAPVVNQTKPASTTNLRVNVPSESTNTIQTQQSPEENTFKNETLKEEVITQTQTSYSTESTALNSNTSGSKNSNKTKPFKLPLYGVLAVFGIFVLGKIFNACARIALNNSQKYREMTGEHEYVPEEDKSSEFERIINDSNLNWQEKYKQYSQADKKQESDAESHDLTYVTDTNAEKRAILESAKEESNFIEEASDNSDVNFEIKIPSLDSKVNKNISFRSRVSQMEHAYLNTLNLPPKETDANIVKSEDDQIAKTMSQVKLTAFAKPKSLKQTSRSMIKKYSENIDNTGKEGKFVILKNSALSAAKRNSASSIFGATDVINYGGNSKNNMVEDMVSKKNSYASTSLDEYLSKLETSENLVDMPLKNEKVISNSKATNPIENSVKSFVSNSDFGSLEGKKILSKYDINSKRGFYLVEEENSTLLISKNDDNISILKKFNSKIRKSLQVRLDYDSVYIVRVGDYKCLVDIAKDKTLLEI